MHPPVDRGRNTKDINSIYAATSTDTTGQLPDTTTPHSKIPNDHVQKKEKQVERYAVFSVSFHKVETPFIIGLWIFCASLAKIGKFLILNRINWD